MKFACAVTIALVLTAAARAAEPQTLARTPAGIELEAWCPRFDDPACRQHVADVAQAHCARVHRNAQYVRSSLMERSFTQGARVGFVYSCVP